MSWWDSIAKYAVPVLASLGGSTLAPQFLTDALGETGASALTGAALGAGGSYLTGGNVLSGAGFGGAGAGLLSASGALSGISGAPAGGGPAAPSGGGDGSSFDASNFVDPTQTATALGAGADTLMGGAGGDTVGAAAQSVANNVVDDGSDPMTFGYGANGPAAGSFRAAQETGMGDYYPDPLGAARGLDVAKTDTGPSFLDKLETGAMNQLYKNPLGSAVAGLGLARSMLSPDKLAGMDDLKANAAALQAQGAQLGGYLQNGTLPAGAQASLDSAVKSGEAAIRSKYAGLHQSGSTAEIQEINDLHQRAAAHSFDMANTLLNTGLKETGMSSDIYAKLMGLQQDENNATGSAVSNFAAALAGGMPVRGGQYG